MIFKNKLSGLLNCADQIGAFVDKCGLTRWIFERSNLAFFYGIFLFLYEISFLRHLIPVVHPFLIAWALFIIVYDIVIRRIWATIPKKVILGLFVVSAALTSILNLEAGMVSNVKAFVMTIIPIFTFYPICVSKNRIYKQKIFIKSTLGASLVCFVTSAVALVLFFMNISRQIVFHNDPMTLGYRYYIPEDPSSGMLLYGVNEDTNHSAAYALVFIAISLITFICCKKGLFEKNWVNRVLKIYSVANIVAQICYFPLANSRGAWLALLVSLSVVLLLYLYFTKLRHLPTKSRVIKSTALTLTAVIIVSVGILGVRTVVSGTANIITSISNNISSNDADNPEQNGTTPNKKPSQGNLPVIDSFEKNDEYMGGGRLYIWQDAFSLVEKMPIFGNGPGNNEYFAKKYDVAEYTLAKGKHVHNSYLDLLLNYGAVGFLIMMVFLILCAKDVLVKIFTDGKNRDASYYLVTFSVLIVAITSFFLSSVFINTTAVSFIMFISLGYLVSEKQIKSDKIVLEA